MTEKEKNVSTNNPLDAFPMAGKSMIMNYMIDTSGSMDGAKIGVVNQTMRELEDELRAISEPGVEISIAALTFDSNAEWVYNKPVPVRDFKWKDVAAGGTTSLGDAFKELDAKLNSKTGFLASPHQSVAPVIFLMSDGKPNRGWEKPLAKLKENPWFKASLKFAVAIGKDAEFGPLAEFTGDDELVLKTHTASSLKNMIKFLSVHSSQIGSSGSSSDDKVNQLKGKIQEINEENAKRKFGPDDVDFDDY